MADDVRIVDRQPGRLRNPFSSVFASTSREVENENRVAPARVALDRPRPAPMRSANVYVDVTKLAAASNQNQTSNSNSNLNSNTYPPADRQRNSRHQQTPPRQFQSQLQTENEMEEDPFHPVTVPSTSRQRPRSHDSRRPPKVAVHRSPAAPPSKEALSQAPTLIQAPPQRRPLLVKSTSSPELASKLDSQLLICRHCGRCKCQACTSPKPLPSRWICDGSFLCNAEKLVDYSSCMCCVKFGLYHRRRIQLDTEDFDSCLGCGGSGAGTKWTLFTMACAFLPCFWFYFPLRGCAWAAENFYSRTTLVGCRCQPRPPANLHRTASEKSANFKSGGGAAFPP